MLKLPNQLSDPKANEIVKIFVNERLIKSDLNEVLGIADPKPSNVIEFPFRQSDGKEKNIKAKVIVHPWDAEDE